MLVLTLYAPNLLKCSAKLVDEGFQGVGLEVTVCRNGSS